MVEYVGDSAILPKYNMTAYMNTIKVGYFTGVSVKCGGELCCIQISTIFSMFVLIGLQCFPHAKLTTHSCEELFM
jgi:hypothetical protein